MDKPFGWGINGYENAFKYYNDKSVHLEQVEWFRQPDESITKYYGHQWDVCEH